MPLGRFLRENKLPLSGVCVIGGAPLTAISIFGLMYKEGDGGITSWAHDALGNWAFWTVIIGLALLAIGGYYLYDFVKKLREFKRHMSVDSKALFIKNLDRIEELAWRLHPKYERMVVERKEKYRIRR